jgi:hypothetical protein
MVVVVKKRNIHISPLRSFLIYRNADLLLVLCLFGDDICGFIYIHTRNFCYNSLRKKANISKEVRSTDIFRNFKKFRFPIIIFLKIFNNIKFL